MPLPVTVMSWKQSGTEPQSGQRRMGKVAHILQVAAVDNRAGGVKRGECRRGGALEIVKSERHVAYRRGERDVQDVSGWTSRGGVAPRSRESLPTPHLRIDR